MPLPAARPSPLVGTVFRGSEVRSAGLLTRGQLRSGTWRRLRQDVYADAALPVTHELLARGVALVAPPAAAFAGLTAAVLWGAPQFAGREDTVEVLLPRGVRWHPVGGVAVSWGDTRGCVVTDGRLRWTSRVRTALDLIRRGPVDDAVILLDRLVQADVVELRHVRAAVTGLPRFRGSRQAREVAALADGLAQSTQETRLRLLFGRSRLPMPVAQYRVRQAGLFVAQVDFGYPERRLAIEYDGAWHGEPGQFGKDRRRLNRLTAAGWRVIFVTAADLYRPEELLARIAAALNS